MAVEVHVEGRVAAGRLPDFVEGVKRYSEYAAAHGYAQPRVLQGLSGDMNTVRLVYTYPELGVYEKDEAKTATDREYGQVAMGMALVEGTIRYSIYRVL
jgi:hypothetical protein